MSTDKYMCPNCQNEVSFGDKFCGKCGYRFGDWGASSASSQAETVLTAQQPVVQTPPAESSGGSFLAKIVKWAVVILVAGGVLAFVSSFFGGVTPQEAIKKGDKEAMETFYNKAKDKEKAKVEIGNAFMEEAYRILDDEALKKNANRQLEAQNKLMKVTEFFVKNDELKELLQVSSKFNNIAVANSKAITAEDEVWKKYRVTLNSDFKQIEGYVVNKVQNTDSQYQCVQYESYYGNVVPRIDRPICILDFGNNRYVNDGVQSVYGVTDKEAEFVDRAGFKKKMMIYKVVDEAGITAIRKAKRLAENKMYEERRFKRDYPKDYFANGIPVTQPNAAANASVPASSAGASVQPVPAGAIASTDQSSFDNEEGYRHDAAKAVDGDIKSCWAEGVKGLGIGEYIQIYFNGTYKVSGLNIWPGHQKTQDLFYKNARPVAIRVIGSDGSNALYPLEDKMGMQRVNFNSPINVSDIKIVVEKVARGNKYEDTCIGEVSFF